jgi:hypothetical protein
MKAASHLIKLQIYKELKITKMDFVVGISIPVSAGKYK